MTGRNWTELFFLDEATALAAGHRPCGYCRRDAYTAYVDAWQMAAGYRPKATEMDRALHPARVRRDRNQVRYDARLATLPDGAFVLVGGAPYLVWDNAVWPYHPDGYGSPKQHPAQSFVTLLTPKPTILVLKAGYVPQVALS